MLVMSSNLVRGNDANRVLVVTFALDSKTLQFPQSTVPRLCTGSWLLAGLSSQRLREHVHIDG